LLVVTRAKQHLVTMMKAMPKLMKRDAQSARTVTLAHRAAGLQNTVREQDDDGVDYYTFSLSSEEPYERYMGHEVLVHEASAVDLSFLNSGNAPLLYQHDSFSGQIGVIEKAWLDETKRRVYVTARFSRRPMAQEVKTDVDDGIMRNVSVGYDFDRDTIIYEEHEEGEKPTYRVTSWKPMEASIVSIPADPTVGVGRSMQLEQEGTQVEPDEIQENGATPNGTNSGTRTATPTMPPVNVMSDEHRAAERAATVSEINALARSHNMADVALDYLQDTIQNGGEPSLARFRGLLRQALPDDVDLVNQDVGLSDQETRTFSVMNLVRAMRDGATGAEIEAARFEIEASEQAARNFEGATRGYRIPTDVMRNWSDFEVDGVRASDVMGQRAPVSVGSNPNVQDTAHLASRFIDNLRNQSSVLRAGVTMLPGLSSDLEIPGGDTNIAAAWLAAEDADVAESVPTFRKVTMAVHDLGAYTDITRRMIQQATIAIEAYVRGQLVEAMALAIDAAGLEGDGAAGVPLGLKNTVGIGSVSFTSAGAPTRGEVIDMWETAATLNAAIGNLGFIQNAAMAAHFMKTPVDAGSGRFMMDGPDSPLLATRQLRSEQVTAGDLYYGNWSDMFFGMWGGLDLDRSTEAKFLSGGIRLRAIQSVDFAVRRVQSFVLGS
jgi:HK97 family phage major capsid protein